MKMSKSLITCILHTKRYYAQFLGPKSIRNLAAAGLILAGTATGFSMAVTHAGVAEWVAGDILNMDIVNGNYDYMLNEDAPPESDNRFHLQMPMMLEGYLDSSNYVSDGSSDDPKLDTALEMTIQPGFFNAEEFELAAPEEWEEAAGDATEFIEVRPPQSGLK